MCNNIDSRLSNTIYLPPKIEALGSAIEFIRFAILAVKRSDLMTGNIHNGQVHITPLRKDKINRNGFTPANTRNHRPR